jgi:hypothetical protein
MYWTILLLCLSQAISAEYIEYELSSDFDFGWEIKDDMVEFTFIVTPN